MTIPDNMQKPIEYNPLLCNLCGLCIGICPVNAIDSHGFSVNIDFKKCVDCGNCISGCPNGALFRQSQNISKQIGHFDLGIIGGGPAGITAAYHASNLGLKVLLIEKKRSLEYPLSCAEGISIEGFNSSGIAIRPEWVNFHIEGGCLISPSGDKTILNHPKAGYMLNRRRIANDLAAEATNKGARILTNSELIDFDLNNRQIKFKFSDIIGNATADYFLAADGIEGAVKRILGITEKPFTIGHIHSAAQYIAAGIKVEPEYPVFYIGNDIAPGGYLWIFPKGNGIANIGLGISPEKTEKPAKYYLDNFLNKHYPKCSIFESTGGMVPANPIGTLKYGNILFIGDAANLTDPLSGGGIAHAFESSRIAVEVIKDAFNSQDNKKLDNYPKRIRKIFGMKLKFYRRLRLLFEKLDDNDLEDICAFLNENFHNKTTEGLDIIGTFKNLISSHAKLIKLLAKL